MRLMPTSPRYDSLRLVAVATIVIGDPTIVPLTTSCATGCSTMNENGYDTVTFDPAELPAAPIDTVAGVTATVTAGPDASPPACRKSRTRVCASAAVVLGRIATRAPSRAALVSTSQV